MTTQLYKIKQEGFKEIVAEAYTKGLLTDIQRDALLAKFNRRTDKEPLSVQNRNALRILRNSLAHNHELTTEFVKQILRFEKVLKLLAMVEPQTGVFCHACKEGLLIERTVSAWIRGKDYELILEQKPAQVCSNSACKTASFSTEVEEKEEETLKEVEKQLRTLRATKPEPLETKKCPLCRSETLVVGQTEQLYRYRQGLYHIRMENIPLKAHCSLCNYKEVGQNISKELVKLEELLETITFELLKLK